MNFASLTKTAAAFAASCLIAGSAFAATLTVATSATFPPFEFQDSKTGTVQGFEIDLVKAVGAKMGRDVKIENIGFDAIIPGILSGTIDMGAAGFSITPERGKRVLFSLPRRQAHLGPDRHHLAAARQEDPGHDDHHLRLRG